MEERIANLERANRRMKIGLCLVALFGIGAVSLALGGSSEPQTVTASEFVLVDGAGAVRARLGMKKLGEGAGYGPSLNLFGEDETLRLELIAGKLGVEGPGGGCEIAGLGVYDPNGCCRIGLGAAEIGASLIFSDQSGTHRAALNQVSRGLTLVFYDRAGRSRLGLSVMESVGMPEGYPHIALSDGRGAPIWSTP